MILGVLPAFLTGAMATLIEEDLHFSTADLGVAISVFYVAATLSCVGGGWLGDRLGARRTLLVAVATSTISLLGIGLLARTWGELLGFLAVGGVGNAIGQPATNIALARLIPFGRQGLAFGLKQSSAAGATLLAGVAVPALGVTLGWRWSFALAGLLCLVHVLAMPARADLRARLNPRREAPHASAASLVVLAAAVTLAVAPANSLASFFVSSAVHQGWSRSAAGTWLAIGSLGSIVARVVLGWLDDRRGAGLAAVAGLMIVGSVGVLLLGRASTLPVLACATVVSFAAGWGWPGLFQLATVRARENAPGSASGIVLTGMFFGGVYGPSAFGFLAEHGSYRLAWGVAAGALAAAGVLILLWQIVITRAAERSR